MQVPVAIYQGGRDQTTMTPPTTLSMVDELCGKGAVVRYREFPEQDHRDVISAAQATGGPFALAAAMLRGEAVPNDCS